MKKLTSLVLAILMALACFSFVASAKETTDGADATALFSGSLLPNTYAKMRKGEAIHVGYFGGSVTNGYGATSQNETSWRGLSLKWLNDTYASAFGCSFYEGAHAGKGGTGTDLNLYRADSALDLGGEDPVDLLFIEFAINDSYESNGYDKAAYYMESIVRKVRIQAPECDIVICLTTDNGKKDTEYDQAKAHADVAAFYGIPTMWFGKRMWAFLTEENGGTPVTSYTTEPWTTYYKDGCHPNDNGYRKYYEFLRDDILKPNLDTNDAFSTEVTQYTVPDGYYTANLDPSSAYYNKVPRLDAYMVDPSQIKDRDNAYAFNFGTAPNGEKQMAAANPGASFTAVFHGKSFGVFFFGTATNGKLQYSIDGGEYKSVTAYANEDNVHIMFFDDIEYGEHTVSVIVRKTENGSDFRLRGFFIDGDPDHQGVTFTQAPNTMPLEDYLYDKVVLTPDMLNHMESSWTGGVLTLRHHHSDVDVLEYAPNPASTQSYVTSQCYNSTLKSVNIPSYKYAVMRYYYEMGAGDSQHATKPLLNFQNLTDVSPNYMEITSADTLVMDRLTDAVFDLTALTYRLGFMGNLTKVFVRPYGTVKPGQLSATEIINIADITFYAEWPYDEVVSVDAAGQSIGKTQSSLSLSGKKILPSAYPYAKITYSYDGSAAENITLDFTELKYGSDIRATSKTIKSGTGNTVVVNLETLARSGQIAYLEDVKLSADVADGETLTVSKIDFYTAYPDANAIFTVKYDLNGGVGVTPDPETGSIGKLVALPTDRLFSKSGSVFLGWNTDPNATEGIQTFYIPEDGATLYAIYGVLATVYANADGSGTLFYEGESHPAYNTLAQAVAALGEAGGIVIFDGVHEVADAFNAETVGAPLVILRGVNTTTAKLRASTARPALKCNTTLETLTVLRAASADPYFNANGKCFTIGKAGVADDVVYAWEDPTDTRAVGFKLVGSTTAAPGNLVINSGAYAMVCADGLNTASNGNTYYTVNGGSFLGANGIIGGGLGFAGASSPMTFDHTGNINVIVNGGTYQTKKATISLNDNNKTTVSGKATLIFNNNMASLYNFTVAEFDYVVKSAQGGTVSIASEASGSVAPTFLIDTDARDLFAVVNGEELEKNKNGKTFFTPDAAGTYEITYVQHEILEYYTVSGSVATQRPNGKSPLGFAQVRVYKDGVQETVKTVDIEDASTKTGTVDFAFDLTPGRYTVEFHKNGYLACTAPLTVNDQDVTMGTFTLVPGDVKASADDFDGDGKVDLDDFVRVLRGLDFASLRGFVDIDEDGAVTVADIGFVKAAFGKTSETAYAD